MVGEEPGIEKSRYNQNLDGEGYNFTILYDVDVLGSINPLSKGLFLITGHVSFI